MGLFKSKRPMLPSFEGESLAALLANPEWAYAIGQAGFDPNKCEVVLRVSEVLVGSGGVPESGRPAILMGQGDRIALAFPAEREVKVSSRDKHRAEIQTTRSVSYTHLRAHETVLDLVCRLLLEKKKQRKRYFYYTPSTT